MPSRPARRAGSIRCIALWVPFLLLVALIVWMYRTIAYKPGGQPIGALERAFAQRRQGGPLAAAAIRQRGRRMINLQFFPSRQIAFYTVKLFLTRSLAVLVALVLVLMTLDLLGESGKILAVPGNSDADLWRYVSLRLPLLISRFLPFSVLLGTLIAFAGLNQHSEVISMKAAGISAHQILAPLIVASLGVAAIAFVFNETVVVNSARTVNAWSANDYEPVPAETGVLSNVWLLVGDDLVRARHVGGSGANVHMERLTIYEREGGALQAGYRRRAAPIRFRARGGCGTSGSTISGMNLVSRVPEMTGLGRGRRRALHARQGRSRRARLLRPQIRHRRDGGRRPPDRRRRSRPVAQIVGAAVDRADALARRDRRLRAGALGQRADPRLHRHGARASLISSPTISAWRWAMSALTRR